MIDPELKAEFERIHEKFETMATKADLEKLTTKEDLTRFATKDDLKVEVGRLRRHIWELAGDVSRIDDKLEELIQAVRKSGVAI